MARAFDQTFVRAQFVGSMLTRYDPVTARDRLAGAVTLFIRSAWKTERYEARIFAYYGFENEHWLHPSVAYNPGTGLIWTIGAHLFGGSATPGAFTTSAFGLFDENDFAYAQLTVAF